MNKKSIVIMMTVSSVATLMLGVWLIIATNTRVPDDQSGLAGVVRILEAAGLFIVSVIITAIVLLVGNAKLRKFRKNNRKSS